jgi:transposase
LDEYLISYYELFDKIERFDQRIKELASGDQYKENVQKLVCLKGVNTNTALTMLVEIGDFKRFRTPGHLASYLGLTPGEHSSGDSHIGLGITKAGNRILRTALMESAQCYTRRYSGAKSKALKERQKGAAPRIVDYADRAAVRLHRRYRALHNYEHKKHNVAVAAVARELACFIWGMLNNEIV